MRYMIHTAPERRWYVYDFLIPSMLMQGISTDEIIVSYDDGGKGNLFACMDSFWWCGQNQVGGTWHLQDDIIISSDFAEKTKIHNSGVVCGAVVKEWGLDWTKTGFTSVNNLWYSFQCIRIPDDIAGECAHWFYSDAMQRNDPEYYERINRKKHDDDFFLFFMLEKHPDMKVYHLAPNIVDHVDYLIGGSLVNKGRAKPINRVAYWTEENLVDELEENLKIYMQQNNMT